MQSKLKLMPVIFILVFLIGIASAETSWGTYKQNECVDLSIVSDATTCTILSMKDPNSVNTISNEEMTASGTGYFNYTFCNTTYLGVYSAKGLCDTTPWENDFDINPIGISQTTSQAIGSAMFIFLMIFITVLFAYIGFRLSKGDFWILGIFMMFLFVLMVIYDFWLGYEYHRTLTGFTNSSMPETMFYILMFILVLGVLASLALLFLKWKKIFKYIKREIKRKDSEDKDVEDWDIDQWGGNSWELKK